MSQFVPLLRNEITKAVRRKLPYFGFVAATLASLIIYYVAATVSNAATANAWGYVGFSMQLISSDIGPIFIVVFAAMLLAEETGTGTIRAALAAPVHRWELYLAKTVAGVFYMGAFSLFCFLCSLILAGKRYAFGPVADAFGVIYSSEKALQELLISWGLSWIPLTALVMYGLLISTVIRSGGAAVAVGISSMALIDFTKHLVGLDPYIFTRYINYPWLTLQQIAQGMETQWRPEVWNMAGLCGISAMVTFAVGLFIFVRQDLNH